MSRSSLVIGSILLAASQQHERCPASPYSPTGEGLVEMAGFGKWRYVSHSNRSNRSNWHERDEDDQSEIEQIEQIERPTASDGYAGAGPF